MKRSLHIGINDYPGTGSDLSGCVNDANDWRETLEARDFQATSLIDTEATKSNMHEAISKIVGDTGRKDIAVITYSGHGTWVPDEDDDEVDGRPNGAFTYVALMTLKDLTDTATYRDWHRENRKLLPHVRYPQTPQISGSRRQRTKWRIFEE